MFRKRTRGLVLPAPSVMPTRAGNLQRLFLVVTALLTGAATWLPRASARSVAFI